VRDKSLVNPWGLSHSPNGPWQVSDNGTGLSKQYTSLGKEVAPVTINFVVSKNRKSFCQRIPFCDGRWKNRWL